MKIHRWLDCAALSLSFLLVVGVAGCGKKTNTTATSSVTQPSEETNVTEPSRSNADSPSVDRTGQMLRHVVLFSFKEESTEEDIQGVADAFAALPSKIDTIAAFEWGTNNSPEGKNDGYTHCFLLSFHNEADRDAYIPHPAHAGEFADVLRPHMKSAFVIDYWGTPSDPKNQNPEQAEGTEPTKSLQHVVFFRFKEDASEEDIKKVEEAFAGLADKIDQIDAFEWGTNNSPEGKDEGFTHCFLVTFSSEKARATYLPHPDHMEFVKMLGPVLDKARVIDYWVN